MKFDGLINHYKVHQKFRNKIVRDEFFELVKLFKIDDARADTPFVTSLEDAGLFTVNVPKSAQPKTKGDYFQLLYAFGQFYLQIYPETTASFLEYLAYMTSYSSEFTVQGLMRLDNKLRCLYIQNPGWNWNQSRFELSRVTDRHLREKNAQLSNPQTRVQPKGNGRSSFRGRGRGKFFGSPPSAVQTSKSNRCINHNKGWCKLVVTDNSFSPCAETLLIKPSIVLLSLVLQTQQSLLISKGRFRSYSY